MSVRLFLSFLSIFLVPLTILDTASAADGLNKEAVDALGYEIFENSLPGVNDGQHNLSISIIQKRFGDPISTESRVLDYKDPDPITGPFKYEELTWHYDGLVLELGADLTAGKTVTDRNVWLRRVTISESIYSLKNDLRIGQSASHFLMILGKPTNQTEHNLIYERDNAKETKPGIFVVKPYLIDISLDLKNNVERIEWSWWSH